RVGEEPPISLGRARNLALFPDGNAVLMVTTPTSPLRITAEGKPNVALPLGAIERLDVGDRPAIAWSGRYVVVRGAAKGQPMRLWRYDLEAKTPPEPVGPDKTGEGTHPITADGAVLAIADRGKGIQLVSLTGAPTRVIGSGEIVPLSFNEAGTSLFVMALHNYPRHLVEIELATGRETELAVISPEDKPDRFTVAIDATGATLAYSTISESAELFIIEPPTKLQ
ncbi:MAG: hypothetical protein NT062_13985, partial [Proteobacteria bacterium]|nr:hypothetical protein [Pseudomonadota bacterium]